jgi:putative flippase GtrA
MTKDEINVINNKIKIFIEKPIVYYMFNSVIVTIIDTFIVWLLYRIVHIDIVTSNTIGVITGFIIHYILSAKAVFKVKHNLLSFLVYLGTFFIGLVFADWLIYIGENRLFLSFHEDISFLLSKGISVVLPFFLLYFIRKIIFNWLQVIQSKHR